MKKLVLKKIAEPIFSIHDDLQQDNTFSIINGVTEINELRNNLEKWRLAFKKSEENKQDMLLGQLASQTAHDLRSPLAALDIAIKGLLDISEDRRLLIRSSIWRIKDITNNLLQKNMRPFSADNITAPSNVYSEEKTIQLLSNLIDVLISEKRMQFRSNIGVEIDSILEERSYGLFVDVNVREFMRLLSNLINNAVEALRNDGQVSVSLTQIASFAVISILDNGCGIPAEILNDLGQRGKTHGKKEGSGLGLYHAKTTIHSWGGNLTIASTPGEGTKVNVTLPLAKAPTWFVEHLVIHSNKFSPMN